MKIPESVVTQSLDTELTLTFHSNLCNSYVSLNNQDVTLITKGDSYLLPSAIAVPYVLRHTVQSILAADNEVEIMIGSGSHFRSLKVTSLSVNLSQIVPE